ncbi:TauD/TfdA family dioxygenase [Streptacidiphilus sp. N1-3]|uniref:TauD/TfdA family dioxygenase n=1 Tax=Streptacidiphilus alkalitolerans TaxID=3342712 RepID=A0ABV6XAQ0_9ACTN
MPSPASTTASPRLSRLPDFHTQPPAPIEAGDWSVPHPGHRLAIATAYRRAGYALVTVTGSTPTPSDVTALSQALSLGEPFTPPMYAASTHTVAGVSSLMADAQALHPFQDRAGQRVHCDATLQQLGEVPTTVMVCVRGAVSGGATYMVNLVAAYAALLREDPQAAAQLAHSGALERRSTFQPDQATVGPAFSTDTDGLLTTRFSRTATDTYHPDTDAGAPDLARALAFMDAAAAAGSRYRTDLLLAPGQALVLANHRLGHGRTAYQDDQAGPRLILRSLFTRTPDGWGTVGTSRSPQS